MDYKYDEPFLWVRACVKLQILHTSRYMLDIFVADCTDKFDTITHLDIDSYMENAATAGLVLSDLDNFSMVTVSRLPNSSSASHPQLAMTGSVEMYSDLETNEFRTLAPNLETLGMHSFARQTLLGDTGQITSLSISMSYENGGASALSLGARFAWMLSKYDLPLLKKIQFHVDQIVGEESLCSKILADSRLRTIREEFGVAVEISVRNYDDDPDSDF
jgi:hypothetical protein